MKRSQKVIYEKDFIKIQCKNGFFLIDEEDLDIYSKGSWYINKRGYVVSCHGKTIFMHRKIMKAKKAQYIDHINCITYDNRRSNLRFCNSSQNNSNVFKRKGTLNKFKGVYLIKKTGRYWAYINKDGKRYSLGVFNKEVEAAKQYNKYALLYHGEFARLNITN